jgi:hypothetical protein
MSTSPTFDDTLPQPAEVEREFLDSAGGDGLTALAWLADHGIDSVPERAAVIQYAMVWTPETGRYRFLIYGPQHIGPKHAQELAVPIYEDGEFIDLLLISDHGTAFARATCRASWLGSVAGPVVRLHAHPMDWLMAGCTGVCHIEPISRKALADLRGVETIQCNDIHTALEAWEWAFSADDNELVRFEIDDTASNIGSYFEAEFKWQAALAELQA